MSTKDLFGDPSPEPTKPSQPRRRNEKSRRAVRVVKAEREQGHLVPSRIEDLLEEGHRARLFWDAVGSLDLSSFYEGIDSVEGEAGRPAIDPQILITLWLYATSEGVGSARELARLIRMHDAYRWICGGVEVGHHRLSDFRVEHEAALDELLTQLLGVLAYRGVVTLKVVAQDGTRMRANAGASSFRRETSLKKCLKQARHKVEKLKERLERTDASIDARREQVRLTAAKRRRASVEQALADLEKAKELDEEHPPSRRKTDRRMSTTDPDARVMKHAAGEFRPGYAMQAAFDAGSRIAVGLLVTNTGSDLGTMEPMLDDIERRMGRRPKELLVDGGYEKHSDIEAVERSEVRVISPEPKWVTRGRARPPAGKEESVEIARWRRRTARPATKLKYKRRGAIAELPFGDLKQHRGLRQLPVRGLSKVSSVMLWGLLTYNLMRCFTLGVEL